MKDKIALFFKGMAMGTVDIVPGVSGSTVAVLLNIYERFIAALKNLNLSLIRALCAPFAHRFSVESRQNARDAAQKADLPWLLTLLAGLACAFVVASFVIPTLMERFPLAMRGFFFGLVLGSIATPVKNIKSWNFKRFLIIAAFASAFFIVLGQHFSPPVQLGIIEADGAQTLQQICVNAPCFIEPAQVLQMPENAALAQTLANTPDPTAAILTQGTAVTVPTAYYLFCLCAGFLAICAMLLPGISGSFVLLILGSYYFMLNTGKGFMRGHMHGDFMATHLLYLLCFVFGALLGIAAFSRLLTWLMKKYPDMTYAAIIGILLGCLRGVWPWQTVSDPTASQIAIPAAFIFLGLTLVAVTFYFGILKAAKAAPLPETPTENAQVTETPSESAPKPQD